MLIVVSFVNGSHFDYSNLITKSFFLFEQLLSQNRATEEELTSRTPSYVRPIANHRRLNCSRCSAPKIDRRVEVDVERKPNCRVRRACIKVSWNCPTRRSTSATVTKVSRRLRPIRNFTATGDTRSISALHPFWIRTPPTTIRRCSWRTNSCTRRLKHFRPTRSPNWPTKTRPNWFTLSNIRLECAIHYLDALCDVLCSPQSIRRINRLRPIDMWCRTSGTSSVINCWRRRREITTIELALWTPTWMCFTFRSYDSFDLIRCNSFTLVLFCLPGNRNPIIHLHRNHRKEDTKRRFHCLPLILPCADFFIQLTIICSRFVTQFGLRLISLSFSIHLDCRHCKTSISSANCLFLGHNQIFSLCN